MPPDVINWTLRFTYEEHIHSKADNACTRVSLFVLGKDVLPQSVMGGGIFDLLSPFRVMRMWALNLAAQNMCMPSAVLR